MKDILEFKLNRLSKVFNLKEIEARKSNKREIAKYYKVNKLAYTLFHSRKGFAHMGLSENKADKTPDCYKQLELIKKHIKRQKSKTVLELGVGKGANSAYLAKILPKVSFTGIDLKGGQTTVAIKKAKKISNFKVEMGDFHNLDSFKNNSIDLTFIIEALCYSNKKASIAREVNRVNRKGGIFIVIDAFLAKPINKLTEKEKKAKVLLEKGMYVKPFEEYTDIKNKIKNTGFTVLEELDLTKQILPSAKKLEKLARGFLKLGFANKVLLKLLPKHFYGNIVSGYLMSTLIEEGIAKYYMTAFQKN